MCTHVYTAHYCLGKAVVWVGELFYATSGNERVLVRSNYEDCVAVYVGKCTVGQFLLLDCTWLLQIGSEHKLFYANL